MAEIPYDPPMFLDLLADATVVKDFSDGSKLVDTRSGRRLRVWLPEEGEQYGNHS